MDFELLARYGPKMLDGLWVTAQLVSISLILGAVLSFPLALMRLSSNRLLNAVSFGYVYFFRGSPLLAQLFLVYFGAGQARPFLEDINLWWFFREAYYCTIFVFALNTAAYQAEILRGSIRSVDKGQWEAAESLGLKYWPTFLKVIIPQALISSLRPYGNEIILMIKGSAIASVVTIFDLMGATKLAYARSFDFTVYLWAAALYLIMVETLRVSWDRMERRLTRHLRPMSDQ